MTFGSLFSGIGGMDLGLERAGMECKWQVEIDQFCQKVLEKHWPGVKRYGDITTVDGAKLERIDLLAGGFPCQDLSQAGKRTGMLNADGSATRSGLWFEFGRLIGQIRPRYVLIENVPGLLVYDGMRRVLGELSRLGYVGCWRCFRASDFGASHLRKRVFIIGNELEHGQRSRRQTPRERRDINTGESQTGCGELANSRLQHLKLQRHHGSEYSRGTDQPAGLLFAPGPNDSRWPDILRDFPVVAPALESPVRGMANGLPDWMVEAMQDRTKRLSNLGNAVVPQIAEWIGRRIMDVASSEVREST